MRSLHLSREWFSASEAEKLARGLPVREATPICGAVDGVATVKRGRGPGLVPPAAWGEVAHCHECYVRMLRDPKAAE